MGRTQRTHRPAADTHVDEHTRCDGPRAPHTSAAVNAQSLAPLHALMQIRDLRARPHPPRMLELRVDTRAGPKMDALRSTS